MFQRFMERDQEMELLFHYLFSLYLHKPCDTGLNISCSGYRTAQLQREPLDTSSVPGAVSRALQMRSQTALQSRYYDPCCEDGKVEVGKMKGSVSGHMAQGGLHCPGFPSLISLSSDFNTTSEYPPGKSCVHCIPESFGTWQTQETHREWGVIPRSCSGWEEFCGHIFRMKCGCPPKSRRVWMAPLPHFCFSGKHH